MYPAVLLIHSWLRWVVVLLALFAVIRAALGAGQRRPWTRRDDLAGKLFLRTLDVQILLGLLLYFVLSPISRSAMTNLADVMRDSATRFWAVEHVFGVLVSAALGHIGAVRVRRAREDRRKQRLAAVFYGLALIALLLSLPWPGTPYERPLFRR